MAKIRRLTLTDLEPLAGLYEQFWGEESSLEKMRVEFARLDADPDYLLLGAKLDGHLVGSLMGIVCHELYGDCRPFLVVEDVIVDQNHRRQGIGSAMMCELEQWAAQRGCGYMLFVTETTRTDAHRFYEALGFGLETHKGFKKRLGE